jgi:hypothetical protein
MTPEKYIIFDAGPLINFSMNGLLPLFRRLRTEFDGKFLISEEVKGEIIDRPIGIDRFQLGALNLKSLLNEKIIEVPVFDKSQKSEFEREKVGLLNIANNTFYSKGKNINIIHNGEASTLALASVFKPNVVAVDERTTRMLCESPWNLRKLLEKKLHTPIKANEGNYSQFRDFKIIRSAELVYIAYKKKLQELQDPNILEAMLHGVKYNGCSISEEEIDEMKDL